jgi:hypothetical protein
MNDELLQSVIAYLNLGYTTKIQAIKHLTIESMDYKIILKELGLTSTYLVVAIDRTIPTDKFVGVVDSISEEVLLRLNMEGELVGSIDFEDDE